MEKSMKVYDLIIIGAGPAGLSAGIYAGRALLDTLLLEQGSEGGQIVQTAEIDNYPGSPPGESGASLIGRMAAQLGKFGVERVTAAVSGVSLEGAVKTVTCGGSSFHARTLILAGGATAKAIGCVGEEAFTGRGISHCGTCDGPFFKDLHVYVAGGGEAALQEAVYLTRFARRVTVIHRRQGLRASGFTRERAFAHDKIDFLYHKVIREVRGDGLLESMIVEDVRDGSLEEIKADPGDGVLGLFVFVGFEPATALFRGQLALNQEGYIVADGDMRTSVAGVFAAGDIREKSLRQVVTAAADGAIAAVQAAAYIERTGEPV
jgi:thioredoxin reductase (NADPH)